MTLKVQLYSQRNSQWASEKLGNGNVTLGLYGCLVTSFASYIGKTPLEINNILKAGGGFQTDLFIWSKCTLLGLNEVYASPSYSGPVTDQGIAKIKSFLDNGQPLICEIDFNPATEGEEMHYVLLCGYDGDTIYAADPWTGTLINLDVYGGPKRAIIKFRAYDLKLQQETPTPATADTIPVDKKVYEALITKLDQQTTQIHELGVDRDAYKAKADNLDTFLSLLASKLNCPKEQSAIIGALEETLSNDESIAALSTQVANFNKTLAEKDAVIDSTKTQLKSSQDALQALTVDFKNLTIEFNNLMAVTPTPMVKFKILGFTIEVWK